MINDAEISTLLKRLSDTTASDTSESTLDSQLTILEAENKAALAAAAALERSSNENRLTLLLNLALLEKAYEKLLTIPQYTATFYKQERIHGKLAAPEMMRIKLRHQPFSVYMKWAVGDKGREALYVEGEDDDKLWVHFGGWKARLLPALNLDPSGRLAMMETRHPITKFGMMALAKRLIQDRRRDLEEEAHPRCQLIEDLKCDDRDCFGFVLEYDNPQLSAVYRKSILYIDKQLSLPVFIKNFTWPDATEQIGPEQLDESTLIEHYRYSNIATDCQLAGHDFDIGNKDYQFRR